MNSNRWALSPLTTTKVKSICDMIRELCLSKTYHTIPFKIVCCNERFSYSSTIYRAADIACYNTPNNLILWALIGCIYFKTEKRLYITVALEASLLGQLFIFGQSFSLGRRPNYITLLFKV